MILKGCSDCGEMLPQSEFTRDARRPDGLNCYCRNCTRRRNRESYARNKAQESERKARACAANREKFLARNRNWREANRERERATNKAYYETRKDVFRKASLAYLARKADVPAVPFTVEQLAQRWAYYGNNCWICGEIADSTDHVKPLSKGGANMLCNLRPACRRCNGGKQNKWPFTPADATWLTVAA